jgi:hypothetical protein
VHRVIQYILNLVHSAVHIYYTLRWYARARYGRTIDTLVVPLYSFIIISSAHYFSTGIAHSPLYQPLRSFNTKSSMANLKV